MHDKEKIMRQDRKTLQRWNIAVQPADCFHPPGHLVKVHMSQSIIHKKLFGFDVKAQWKQAKWPRSKRAGHTHNIASHQSCLSAIHHFKRWHSLPIRSLQEQTISVPQIWITLLLMQPWTAPSLIHTTPLELCLELRLRCAGGTRMKIRVIDNFLYTDMIIFLLQIKDNGGNLNSFMYSNTLIWVRKTPIQDDETLKEILNFCFPTASLPLTDSAVWANRVCSLEMQWVIQMANTNTQK